MTTSSPVAPRLLAADEVSWLEVDAVRVEDRMKDRLYCAEQGMFADRFWSGEFSSTKTLTRIFPLLAEPDAVRFNIPAGTAKVEIR